MNEVEWLACSDPEALLHLACERTSERKLRLFACACCRRFGDRFPDERIRHAVEVAERLADGGVAEDERAQAIRPLLQNDGPPLWRRQEPWADAGSVEGNFLSFVQQAAVGALHLRPRWASYTHGPPRGWEAVPIRLCREVCALLRDVVGNPFRPAVIDPHVLAWKDGIVRRLAQSTYDTGTFDRLADLGETLSEAGCASADVLHHCSHPGPHVRGYWVVDALIGRT